MINVMFELRSKVFPSGETVKARLKSAVAMNTDVSPVNYRYPNTEAPMLYAPQLGNSRQQTGNKKMQGNKKKKSNFNGSNNGKSNVSQNKNTKSSKNSGNAPRRHNNSNGQKQTTKKSNPLRKRVVLRNWVLKILCT